MEMQEKDRLYKVQQDRKKKKHEEELFLIDLANLKAAEDSKGAAMEKIRQAEQEVIQAMIKSETKNKKNNHLREKANEELKARISV